MTTRLEQAVEAVREALFELYHGKPYSEKDPDFTNYGIEEDIGTITPILKELTDEIDRSHQTIIEQGNQADTIAELEDEADEMQAEIDRLTAECDRLKEEDEE